MLYNRRPMRHPASALRAIAAAILGLVSAVASAAADSIADFSTHAAGSTKTVDHSAFDRILANYVVEHPDGINRVAYARLKKEAHQDLKGYVARLEATDVKALDRPEQFAFWANLYNAKTIDIVLDHYPVGSIREISIDDSLLGFLKKSVGAGGPWKAKVLKINGQALTLDNVEHDILRPVQKDPRVHYSVNCASYGCPNLATEAFTGAKLDAQLDAGARAFVNHPRGIAVENGKITASSIYEWFEADFGGNAASVLAHVRTYATPELAQKLTGLSSIAAYQYDWKLNDTPR